MHGLDIVIGSDEWHVYTSKMDFLETLKVVMMIHSPRHCSSEGGGGGHISDPSAHGF